jgi:hypothetical protein
MYGTRIGGNLTRPTRTDAEGGPAPGSDVHRSTEDAYLNNRISNYQTEPRRVH